MNTTLVPKPIQKFLTNRETLTKALFSRPESLSSLLPYDDFIEEGGIFQQRDGSLGAVFEVQLLEHEVMTEKEIIDAVRHVKPWFSLPEECVLQVIYEQSAISSKDRVWDSLKKQYPSGHGISSVLFDKRLEQYQGACGTSQSVAPLSRRTLLVVRYFLNEKQTHSYKEILANDDVVLGRTFKDTVRELTRFKHLVADFSANSNIKLRQLDAQGVLDILRRFFNPKTYYKRSFAPYNPGQSLAQQFIYSSPTLDYQGIEREGIKTRTISLKTSPQYAYPGGMAYFTKLSFPFTMSLNFNFPSKGKVKRFFDFKEFFLQNTPSAKARRQREEILEVQDKLAREDRCLHMTFNVTIEGENEDILDERTREIVNVFHNELECEVIVENDIGLGLCLNSLPLNYMPDSDMSAQRYIRILRSDAVNFVPLFDSFRGLKNPLQLFLSRENNLVPFSLTENETSNHTVVLADSGSGKSAFVIDCIQAAKRTKPDMPEPLIFIIDKKSSYTMLAEYFDGDLTVFDRNGEVPFSPFRGVYDEDKIAFLTKLIITAVKLTSPSFEIESEHQASISRALKFAYIKKCKQQGLAYVDGELLQQNSDKEVELTMEDFVAELGALVSDGNERLRTAIDDLVHKLRPFYDDGIYAKFFRGSPERKRKKCLFYAYDLDALDSDPVLQTLMTMAVVEEIRQTIKLPENKGRGGFIVFEEFAMLGRNNPAVRDFAVDMAETCRKLGYWLITLTPRPQNYFELDVGKAFWGVADNYIFLQMNTDNVDYLAQHSSMLDEANVEIIKSLRTKRGQYAEVFYMNKKKTVQGAFRYHPTPLSMWLSPTNAKAAAEADRALKKFAGKKWEALSMLAEKYPNGL